MSRIHHALLLLGTSTRTFFDTLFSNSAYQPLDTTPEQVYLADEERPSNDLFDGLICAAALSLELPLLSRDSDIREWGRFQVIWESLAQPALMLLSSNAG